MRPINIQFAKAALPSSSLKRAIAAAIILILLVNVSAYASVITGAKYSGTINVSNNSTAASNVCTIATIDTASLISTGYANSTLSNTSIQNDAGVDVAYMPAVSGNSTWSIYVPAIGTTTLAYKLYTGGGDMSGKIRYFPGTAGMLVSDEAALRAVTSVEFEWQGFLDMTAVGGELANKNNGAGAYDIRVYVSASGTLTALATWSNAFTVSLSGLTSGEKNVKLTCTGAAANLYVSGTTNTTAALPQMQNSADITFVSGNGMPYVEYIKYTVDGTLQGHWSWQNSATFTDQSGHGHDATPTFRTSSSDADVSASLASFAPISTAQITSFTAGGTNSIVSGSALFPTQMYTENDTSTFPGAAVINTLLDTSGTPRAFWWYLFIFIGIGICGLLTYEATTLMVTRTPISQPGAALQQYRLYLQTGGKDGSLLAMCIVIEFLLVMFGLMGATSASSLIPFWPAMIFLIPILMVISAQWSVKTS